MLTILSLNLSLIQALNWWILMRLRRPKNIDLNVKPAATYPFRISSFVYEAAHTKTGAWGNSSDSLIKQKRAQQNRNYKMGSHTPRSHYMNRVLKLISRASPVQKRPVKVTWMESPWCVQNFLFSFFLFKKTKDFLLLLPNWC
jgi:hypothetical protein